MSAACEKAKGIAVGRVLETVACIVCGAFLIVPLVTCTHRAVSPPAQAISLRVSDDAGQLHIQWDRRSEAVLQSQTAYLEIADGPVPVQIELDRTLLQTGSVYYSRTSGYTLVKMVLIAPTGRIVEDSVPFVGTPPPAPDPITEEHTMVTSDWAAPVRSEPPAATTEQAQALDSAEGRYRESAWAERRESRPAAPAPRRLTLPAVTPAPRARAEIEPPQLITPTGAELRGMPTFAALRAPSVPDHITNRPKTPSRPATGQIIWTGRLERRGVIEIEDQQTSVGHVSGGLPGAPAVIEVFPGELVDTGLRLYTVKPEFANRRESPGPQNGWNPTNYVWDPARARDVSVLEPPDTQNGWKHLVMRAENRSYAVIVVRWMARQPLGN